MHFRLHLMRSPWRWGRMNEHWHCLQRVGDGAWMQACVPRNWDGFDTLGLKQHNAGTR